MLDQPGREELKTTISATAYTEVRQCRKLSEFTNQFGRVFPAFSLEGNNMKPTLNGLPYKTLALVLKHLKGGSIGFDPFRDERTKAKSALIDFICDQFAPSDIADAVMAVIGAKPEPGPTDVEYREIEQPIEKQEKKMEAVLKNPAVGADPALALAETIRAIAGGAVNEERVRQIVAESVQKALADTPVMKHEFVLPDGKEYKPEGHVRPEFQKVLRKALAGVNILLVGPAGSGKTHLAHQVAEAMQRPFASISCTAGMSESQLSGWLIPGEGGAFTFLDSDFVRMYEEGGVFLFDEIDAADENTLLFINQALANGGFNIPARQGRTYVKKHKDFVCIAAANTFGQGANAQYAGRSKLDESTLDRFRAGQVEIGYDSELEKKLAHPDLLAWAKTARKRINDYGLRRVLSTRFLIDGTKLLSVGETLEEVKATFFLGWKADEMAKVNY